MRSSRKRESCLPAKSQPPSSSPVLEMPALTLPPSYGPFPSRSCRVFITEGVSDVPPPLRALSLKSGAQTTEDRQRRSARFRAPRRQPFHVTVTTVQADSLARVRVGTVEFPGAGRGSGPWGGERSSLTAPPLPDLSSAPSGVVVFGKLYCSRKAAPALGGRVPGPSPRLAKAELYGRSLGFNAP